MVAVPALPSPFPFFVLPCHQPTSTPGPTGATGPRGLTGPQGDKVRLVTVAMLAHVNGSLHAQLDCAAHDMQTGRPVPAALLVRGSSRSDMCSARWLDKQCMPGQAVCGTAHSCPLPSHLLL